MRRKGAERGFTLAEMITVLLIIALIMSAIALVVPMLLREPTEAQAQVDDVQSTALALYRMQHDARPSTIMGISACGTTPVVSCSTPAPPPAPQPLPTTQAIVLVTANGTGQFKWDSSGNPKWQGYVVYWLTPNAGGTGNELRRAFYPMAVNQTNFVADAVTALSAVLPSGNYTTVAQDVRSMSAAFDQTDHIVELQLDGGQSTGNQTSLRLSGNSYVRN